LVREVEIGAIMSVEKDYLLGTHDAEISRLGLQHRVWRSRALDAWQRAGFTVGQTLLDVGCGPGFASLDLADIVGPSGRIKAMDRSRRFLDVLAAACTQRSLQNIDTLELDLNDADLPLVEADGAWVRWVFAFVKHPRNLLARIRRSLRPGGSLVLHEYIDYSTWRLAPPCKEIEEFVQLVMKGWRADGGEPDIGLCLPQWLQEDGFTIQSLRPIIDVITPSSFTWQWPRTFLQVGLRRLVDLGLVDEKTSKTTWEAFEAREAQPHALMITPTVVEIIAKRG
jgi:SAM-dependent methyltransferase